MIPIAWLASYWLRFNLESFPDTHWWEAVYLLPVVMILQGGMFWYFGLYRGIWRFASLPDLVRILKAVTAGIALTAVIIFLATRLEGAPRSVFVLDGILLMMLLGGPRLLYRWAKDRHLYRVEGQRALIVGAGGAGEILIRDMLRDLSSPYHPIALVDDNAGKVGKEIHGLRVVGKCGDIPAVVSDYEIDIIVIALPSASTQEIRRVVEICESTGLPFRMLPRVQVAGGGQVSLHDVRAVHIEDLLGRDPVQLDWQSIAQSIHGKTVFITGAGGSIGAELCRQIARLGPMRLVAYEQCEFNLYEIEKELQRNFPTLPLIPLLGDVCDTVAVESALRLYQPQVVFHSAAYKHVPILEGQARSAVMNNILGTHALASLADRYGCETFVLISSDKAVNPANIMGVTKRVAEMVCQDLGRRSKTRFITVRFGNVLGSSGSVIPLFQQQIERGGPVTVTHPEVQRYFMTIPEACQLILQAGAIGKGGEVLVLDMGEPVKISYLAEQLIRLAGKKPGEDIEIVYTGLRPGEKLTEELVHDAEPLATTRHPKIFFANCRPVDAEVLVDALTNLQKAASECDNARLRELLTSLVPEAIAAGNSSEQKQGATIYPWKPAGREVRA
ncbi:MAG: polysaccharide biosynthesis protein [Gammaproteobacteria bacterium]|nr:polysaccharide biosynthesis protein [Gammaproteobacteria bacterium]